MICDHCHEDTRAVILAGDLSLCYRCNNALHQAAPDLLEALENLLSFIVNETPCGCDAQGNDWPEVQQARAAIAKARPERSQP